MAFFLYPFQDSCIDILCPIGLYRGASGKCIQLISTLTETAIAMAFELRSSDHGGWIDPLTETEMLDLSNALKTRMKQDQLEWCDANQLFKYVNDVKSKPVIILYSFTVRLHNMKAGSFFDIIQNLIQVPIELQVNGQRMNISLELYHSALDEQNMSPIYKFPDNVANIPKTQTKFKNDLHPSSMSHCSFTYHTQLSKLSFCEQVILRANEIIPENTEDGSRIFLISRNKYLYNFVVDFDKNVRICIDDFIELDKNADSSHPEDIKDKNEAQVNLTKGLSLIGLFLDALFLTSAVVATCLCHDLARQVKLQNLHLVIRS